MMKIDKLVRQKRKTVGLFIDDNGLLIIKAPMRVPLKEIKRIVETNRSWIYEKQALTIKRKAEKKVYNFSEGEFFPFLGIMYPFYLVERQVDPLVLNNGFSMVRSAVSGAKIHFERWYKEQASIILSERVNQFAGQNGFLYRQIRVKKLRSRWGSCSSKNNLNFNLWLVLAPLSVIDYVVVHELCHLRERNHSSNYWNQVSEILPGYKNERSWLKQNGKKLMLW